MARLRRTCSMKILHDQATAARTRHETCSYPPHVPEKCVRRDNRIHGAPPPLRRTSLRRNRRSNEPIRGHVRRDRKLTLSCWKLSHRERADLSARHVAAIFQRLLDDGEGNLDSVGFCVFLSLRGILGVLGFRGEFLGFWGFVGNFGYC